MLQKLQNAPNQLEALTEIAKAIERLNLGIERLEKTSFEPVDKMTSSDGESLVAKDSKTIWTKCKSLLVPVCALGSFLALLGMLLLQIFGK